MCRVMTLTDQLRTPHKMISRGGAMDLELSCGFDVRFGKILARVFDLAKPPAGRSIACQRALTPPVCEPKKGRPELRQPRVAQILNAKRGDRRRTADAV